jgi:hypothetical protein
MVPFASIVMMPIIPVVMVTPIAIVIIPVVMNKTPGQGGNRKQCNHKPF